MYCHHCGKKRMDDAIYCSQCGRRLAADEEALVAADAPMIAGVSEIAASSETEAVNSPSFRSNGKRSKGGSLWSWLIPISLALVMAASVFTYYKYQLSINDKVIRLQNEAKTEALAGKYAEALALLKEAANDRPKFTALRKDALIIAHAAEQERAAEAASKQLEENNLSEAELALIKLKDELKGHTEPIYARVREKLTALNDKLGIMKLTDELADLVTVDELAAKLSIASHLDSEDAVSIREQLVEKIVNISLVEAEALLKKKNYTEALAVTVKALTFAKEDDRLVSLENRINNAQAQYEKSEQQRLEQAMQKEAAEDLKNQTAAVDVIHIKTTLDENGDVYIEAELKNVATRPIYSVKIQYTVLDKGGKEVAKGKAAVLPDYVEPGENMSFKEAVKDVHMEDTTVIVDHITWYLD
ncbi:FxLYD domain-containing protein [Paenibacillus castaneae]|uniref:FxLYD domain-containing protein n=1 Tax=Paenibacillus castaneae TaxID=474957 RepID=UPI001ABA96CD